MRLAPTVTIETLQPELLLGLAIAAALYAQYDASELTVLELAPDDGPHASVHNAGLRATFTLPVNQSPLHIVHQLRSRLGGQYAVTAYTTHLALEFLPNRAR